MNYLAMLAAILALSISIFTAISGSGTNELELDKRMSSLELEITKINNSKVFDPAPLSNA